MTQTDLGRIDISPTAVAHLASAAVVKSYGVVGMASPDLRAGIAELLNRDLHRGVRVQHVNDQFIIDLYVIIQYGTRISEVAQQIMRTVKYRVEKSLGIPVSRVNVHVQGLRMTEPRKKGAR
ncbi:MAG: Asp23/Gls24 family envelope stress response protein [Anaerolineae bacterium]|nr:Asp23/Gls24 family envelope stress response protein [Anaerolineae bacterium]